MLSLGKTQQYQSHRFDAAGHPSGRGFLSRVEKLLRDRKLNDSYRLDTPTESKGNCYNYALMQNMHRREIYVTLSDEMKELCGNYHDLRVAIVEFVKNVTPNSEYFELIDESRTTYAHTQIDDSSLPTWEEVLTDMSQDGKWFTDQFVKFSACFLKRDIIIHTATGDLKYCGSSKIIEGDAGSNHQCSCKGPQIHIANIGNYHFQSILPIENSEKNKEVNQAKMIYRCNVCNYTSSKASNLIRHQRSKHSSTTILASKMSNLEVSLQYDEANSNEMETLRPISTDYQYLCNVCGQGFEQPQFLSRHVKIEHERIYQEERNSTPQLSEFKCQFCEKSYSNKKNLIRHVSGSHSNRQYWQYVFVGLYNYIGDSIQHLLQ